MTITRRRWLAALSGLLAASALPLLSRSSSAAAPALNKSKSEWKRLLPADRYEILFEEGTEPPGSSPLDREKRDGTFICAACHQPLFDSSRKYDSGTGWPSFWEPLPAALGTKTDYKLFLPRSEYHCARCGGHQGHVFKDGPKPTGLRYCNNGLALQFVARGGKLPDLRV